MLEVDRLTKRYDATWAVRDLSFRVRPGEILGLLGPNGAGKTSTLRCLAGILRPTAGTIRVAGHSLEADPVRAKAALAFVPDEPHFFPYLSVAEHLRFVARLYGVPDAEAREPELLAEVELAGKRDALPGELSRGMRQKLAIACALLHDPRVLILDEPLTGLDPGAIRRMKRTIRARAEAGAAVILSSHLLSLAEELCTHLLVIQEGQRVAFGSTDEVAAERPQLAGRGLEELFLALTGEGSADGEIP